MNPNQVEIDQSKSELKHLGFIKEIALKFLVLLSNVYDFAKENSGVLKTTVVSAENAVVSVVSPVYEKLEYFSGRIIVFVDEKFDKYAPSFSKNLLDKFQSLIEKSTPLVQKLLTTTQTVITPLIAAKLSLLQKFLNTTISVIQKITTTIKSTPFVGKAQTLLQKGPKLASQAMDTTKDIVGGIPLVGNAAQSLITNPTDVANQTLDTTKDIVGGIPLVGNAAQSLITNPADVANQALDTTKSMVGDIPLFGNVAQSIITNPADLAKQALDTTKSIAGGIPLVSDAAQSLITNPADLANQLVNKNPVLEAVNSVAQNIIKEAQTAGTKAKLQSAYMSFKLVVVPVIAQMWYKVNTYRLGNALAEFTLPVVEYLSELYNKVVTYMDGKGYSLFGYLPSLPIEEMKVSYKLVKTTMDGLSAVGDLAGGLVGMNDNNT